MGFLKSRFGWTKWWALGSIDPMLRRPYRSLFRVQDTNIRGPDSESYANYVLYFFSESLFKQICLVFTPKYIAFEPSIFFQLIRIQA